MNSPYFSIITPTYNRSKFLINAIQSVLKQTFDDWEYIIIDDASTDDTIDLKSSYNDPRIIYLKNEVNCERSFSKNKGIESAKGKYICFLDSDDEFLEDHLQVLYKNIKEKNEIKAIFFTSTMQQIDEGEIHKREFIKFEENKKLAYIMRYTFIHDNVAVHSEILQDNRFDTLLHCFEDLDIWLHIALKYPVYQIKEYTTLLHYHSESFGSFVQQDNNRYVKGLRNYKYIFRKEEFKKALPVYEKRRLISMCHFRLSLKYENEKRTYKMYISIIKSFFLFPKGYNRRTNTTMLVMFIYHISIIGIAIRGIIRLFK